jgi:hypothetical protein
MQENFKNQHIWMARSLYNGGHGASALEAQPSVVRKMCQKVAKAAANKSVHEGFDNGGCIANEGDHAANTEPAYRGKVVNPSNTRQFNIPPSSIPINKIAGGASEKFAGRIDGSKYGNYGTSMLQPVETFSVSASNSRLKGSTMDMSWASGITDAKCKAHITPFQPPRYPQYRA